MGSGAICRSSVRIKSNIWDRIGKLQKCLVALEQNTHCKDHSSSYFVSREFCVCGSLNRPISSQCVCAPSCSSPISVACRDSPSFLRLGNHVVFLLFLPILLKTYQYIDIFRNRAFVFIDFSVVFNFVDICSALFPSSCLLWVFLVFTVWFLKMTLT